MLPRCFSWGSAGKESTCDARDLGSNPGLGRSPGERKGSPLEYSGLENSMARIVHGVTKSRPRLSDFYFQSLVKIFQNQLLPYSVSQKIFLWILPIMQKFHTFWHMSLNRKRYCRKSAAFPSRLQTLKAQPWLLGPNSRNGIGFHGVLFLLSVFWLHPFSL